MGEIGLVPIDGPKEARKALEEAVYLAGLSKASLTLMHVVDLNKSNPCF